MIHISNQLVLIDIPPDQPPPRSVRRVAKTLELRVGSLLSCRHHTENEETIPTADSQPRG